MTTERKYTFPDLDIEISIGRLADQADGSVLLTQGGTQVLSTVCASESKEFPGFLPLMVDYREQLAAAGKIPGGYLKREGRPSDKEVLTARLIDRSIRPLFPHHYFDQIQVMNTVYSVDQKNEPNLLAMLGASIALTISRVPFLGPVGAVQIGRIDGEFVFNPKYDESEKSDGKIIVVGTADGICMVEGAIDQMNESDFIDALFKAHDLIKEQVVWQEKIAQEIGVPKEAVVADPSWDSLTAQADSFLTEQQLDTVQVEDKAARGVAKKTLKKGFVQLIDGMVDGLEVSTTIIKSAFDEIFKKKLTANMFARNKRIDGRDFDQVRTITSQAPMLVRTHGSAFFQRGGTQALATATLGSGQDEQRMEDLMSGNYEKSFMLHYNFPPFSVGEVRFLRGVSRREVGHGYLALTAIESQLPSKQDFPYTLRIVSDILASDGSSSMATVCASTLALMDAGVPIKNMVSGVAMGLVQGAENSFRILTDITGMEDALGLMDFKVAGTPEGITAIQMDIKHKGGLSREVLEQALEQARQGRLTIMEEMKKTLSEPREELSGDVPQSITLSVPVEKIGAVIGSGGKIIKEIIEKTGTSIDIDDDGTVRVFGQKGPGTDQAVSWIKVIGGNINRGDVFHGKIKRVTEFGIFVEIAPGVDGLVHISMIQRERQASMAQDYPGDKVVTVIVMGYDPSTGRIKLKFVNEDEDN